MLWLFTILMTDTDSFIFKCETEDIYQDIVNNEVYMKKVESEKLNLIKLDMWWWRFILY